MSEAAKHAHPKHMIGTPLKARHSTPIHQPGKRLMHSIPLRFVQKKVGGHGSKSVNADLNLTSMIDYLVIVVVFLLSNFGTAQQVSSQQGLEVPTVPHAAQLRSAPIVSISSQSILLDTRRIASPQEISSSTGVIEELQRRLREAKENFPLLHPNETFRGEIVFQVDRNTRWDLIKRVAQTCALSGYVALNFAVAKGSPTDLPSEGASP
jgi:biopolymer transport protein ExbD